MQILTIRQSHRGIIDPAHHDSSNRLHRIRPQCRRHLCAPLPLKCLELAADHVNARIVTITTYMYWGMVESGAAVVAACLPSLSLLARSRSLENAWQSLVSRFSPSSSRLESSRHRGDDYIDMSDSNNRKTSEEPMIHMRTVPRNTKEEV